MPYAERKTTSVLYAVSEKASILSRDVPILYIQTDSLAFVCDVAIKAGLTEYHEKHVNIKSFDVFDRKAAFPEALDEAETALKKAHNLRLLLHARGKTRDDDKPMLSADTVRLLWAYIDEWQMRKTKRGCYVLLYGSELTIPTGMGEFVGMINIPPLSDTDFDAILGGLDDSATGNTIAWYRNQMGGMEEYMVVRLATRIIHQTGKLAISDAAEAIIRDYKQQRVNRHGKLTCLTSAGNPAGNDNIAVWIDEHKAALKDQTTRAFPKGMLLLGIPGAGKTETAKSIARTLGIPLVQLHIGEILGRYVGDSEHNMKQALDDLAFCAPCVVFVDELEKAMSGASGKNGGDSGTMTRLLGQMLSFIQDNPKRVFMVATANDISTLPPEFFRNGRFDVRFCIMMPTYAECLSIMAKKLDSYQQGLGECAGMVLDKCIGDAKQPVFLTGADVTWIVNELFYRIKPSPGSSVTGGMLMDTIRVVAPWSRAYGDTRYPLNMENIAKCYMAVLPRSMHMAGGKAGGGRELFAAENYHPERITAFVYVKESKGNLPELPHCMDMPKGEMHWYDRQLFIHIRDEMDRLLLMEARPENYNAYQALKKERAEKAGSSH